MPVLKQDKMAVRICGDYTLTTNCVSCLEHYPLPKVDELFTTLAGDTLFTKLDMSLLDDQSKELLTINIYNGLFAYNKLPFGVAFAPGIFQCTMESLLKGIPNVLVYLDDILVTGETQEQDIKNLHEVLSRFRHTGLRLKCQFLARSVEYLGFTIDQQGIHPSEGKLRLSKLH